MHSCKFCKRDLSSLLPKRNICRTCSWKNKYFSGLYWEALKQDDFTCISCKLIKYIPGKRTVNVHHKNHNPRDNRLDNFEVLCISCHAKKRQLSCVDCGILVIASSANQRRCNICANNHSSVMNKKRLARFYEKRGFNYYANWLRKTSL